MTNELTKRLLIAATTLLMMGCNRISTQEENAAAALKQICRTDKVTVSHGSDATDKSVKTVQYEIVLDEHTTIDDTKPDLVLSTCALAVNLRTMAGRKKDYPLLVIKLHTDDGAFKKLTETRYRFTMLDSLQPVCDVFDTVRQAFLTANYSNLFSHFSEKLKAISTADFVEQNFSDADKKFGVAEEVTLAGFRFIRRPNTPNSYLFFMNIKRGNGKQGAELVVEQDSRKILVISDKVDL